MSTMSRIARLPLMQRGRLAGRRWGGFVGLVGSLAVAVTDGLDQWQRRLRDRDMLLHMSTSQLKDIGLSRADALNEAEKPFWRA